MIFSDTVFSKKSNVLQSKKHKTLEDQNALGFVELA